MNLGKVMIEAVWCSRKSTRGRLGLSLSCATGSPGDLGNSFTWAQVSGKWKGCSHQLWELFSCDSLSSMNLTPKWSVINLCSSCQLRIFSGRNVIRWINRGHLSSGAFLPQVLLPWKGGGADGTLHRCPWSSDENPDIHCQFSGARHGTRSPGIKSLALDLSTDSLLGNAIPPLVQVNWLSGFLPIVCGARISLSLLWAVCFCCACAGAGLLKDNQRARSLVSLISDYSSFHSFMVFLLN